VWVFVVVGKVYNLGYEKVYPVDTVIAEDLKLVFLVAVLLLAVQYYRE
jgi:hypothetical protein